MDVHLNSVRPAASFPTAPVRAHAAASGTTTTRSASAKSTAENAGGFRAVLSLPSSGNGTGTRSTPATSSTTATQPPASTSTSASTTTTPSSSSAAAPATVNGAPTAEQVFGANPWISNPSGTGPDGIAFGYNPIYFATAQTAAVVAQMVGGKVVQDNEFTKNTPGDPFAQQQPNEMVQLPDGALINPGLIASLYTHGLPQWEINQAITNDVNTAEASVNTGA